MNRVGVDGNQISYSGASVALDELGAPIIECGAQAQVATMAFSEAALAAHRARFPAQLDADQFEIRN